MKKYLIVCLAWLFLCKISMGQKKTDGYVYSEKDVIISTVQHFDTLYCFYNLKKNPPFVKNRIFDNQAKLYYWSDTLDIPKKTISGRKFAKNMLKPHSFHKEVGYTFLHRVILPAIKDSMLYYRVKNSFTNEWQPHSTIVKIIEEGEAHYKMFIYKPIVFCQSISELGALIMNITESIAPQHTYFQKNQNCQIVLLDFLFPFLNEPTSDILFLHLGLFV